MILHSAERIKGMVRVPGDKSIAHRALILGAVAKGKQVIDGVPRGSDLRSTIECLRTLGTFVEEMPDGRMLVLAKDLRSGAKLDAGNSGTTARLLAGILAGHEIETTVDGDESLRRRPMDRVAEPLAQMGATIRTNDGRLPMTIKGGRLRGTRYRSPVASAQVKSAILLAGLFADGDTVVEESQPTRDHTERLLRTMGVPVTSESNNVTLRGPASPRATHIKVPGDISSAAFLIVAATCLAGSELYLPSVGVNTTRRGLVRVLVDMGANVEIVNNDVYAQEPVADVIVKSASLRGVSVEGSLIPSMIDELPILAVAATQAEGDTVITHAQELRNKESDRIASVVANLRAFGAEIEDRDDGFVVRGPTPLRAAEVDSFGDHRIAMAMAVAAFIADGTTRIANAGVIDISYPTFFEDLSTVIR